MALRVSLSRLILAASLCLGAVPPAAALSCSLLGFALDDARQTLAAAGDEPDLLAAQAKAWRAGTALEELAQAAHGCVCAPAGQAFGRAVLDARLASRAEDSAQFGGALALAVGAFNAGQTALQSCGRLSR